VIMKIFVILLCLRSTLSINITLTSAPTVAPSLRPSSSMPSFTSTLFPTALPSPFPSSSNPTSEPTHFPTPFPSFKPSMHPSPVPSYLGPGWIEVNPLPSPSTGPVNITWKCHGDISDNTLVQVELVTCDANQSNAGDLVGAPLTSPEGVSACTSTRIEWNGLYLFCPSTADLRYVDCVKVDVTTNGLNIKRGLSNRVKLDCTIPTSSNDDDGDELFIKSNGWQLWLFLSGLVLLIGLFLLLVRCRKNLFIGKNGSIEEPLLGADTETGNSHTPSNSHFNNMFVAFPRSSSAVEDDRGTKSEEDETSTAISTSPRIILQRIPEEAEPFGSHYNDDADKTSCLCCCFGQRRTNQKDNDILPATLSPTSAHMRHLVSANLETGIDDWLLDYQRLCIGEMVGVGATSTVFRATYASATVAAKRIPVFDWNCANKEQLRREAALLARLHHPNIIRFYGVCLHAQHAYIITEFVPETLATCIENATKTCDCRLPPALFYDLCLGIAFGLEFLHSKNFAHRDIKPSNILIDDRRHAKLCDFGLSKRSDAAFVTNTTGVGTPAFMSPEVILGASEDVSHQPESGPFRAPADVFSFGMLMFCTFACQQPFDHLISNIDKDGAQQAPPQVAPFAIMSKIANGERPTLPSDMPSGLKLLVSRCWSQRPADRPNMKFITTQLQKLATTTHSVSSNTPIIELQPSAIHARKRATSLSVSPIIDTAGRRNSLSHPPNTSLSEQVHRQGHLRGNSTSLPQNLRAYVKHNDEKKQEEDPSESPRRPDFPPLSLPPPLEEEELN